MCGISGIVARSADRYRQAQDAMVKAQHHRGPDGNAVHGFENCLLGHNRLSIIDLDNGAQPMLSNDGKKCIVFNGEIYGYKSIRERLDYSYNNTSDTEVILAMYERYGQKLTEHLPGMFAFAIWDEAKQELFTARDRFGEKPFFYAIADDGLFVFASEIKAIVASGIIEPEIDNKAISRYLNYGYTGPLQTIYKNVHILPPAHTLSYKDGKVDVRKYWQYPATSKENISLSDAAERFEELFTEAVRKQMVADVEVCAFLSGGLDSTSVVSAAHKFNPSLKTLAFGYKHEDNELSFAKAAADLYGTDHHELLEENVSIEEFFLQLPNIYDEPFSDSSAVATYAICKLASNICKVVLTGDGGDELLGGYTWWYKPLVARLAEKDTSEAKFAFVKTMAVAEKIKEKAGGSRYQRKWRDKYLNIKGIRTNSSVVDAALNKYRQLDSAMLESIGLPMPDSFNPIWQEEGNINDAMKVDIADYMPGDILVKTDRAAMANSLELRSPFLDVDLAEFCISMPGEYKVNSNSDKILLREAMSKSWPSEIQKRSKQGFGVSKEHWEGSKGLKEMYKQYIYSKESALYDILPYTETTHLIKKKPGLEHRFFLLAVWLEKKYKN